ncbi:MULTISPECIES: LysR family transcriptional regulator [unclassified Acinetobacter]|uniref:LysR family transcriptional regulator n=1 Tax=unclassified Acinetobacter TaxID=196816 RepID=UPI0019090F80|nr:MULTISPECIES: LysR family transcriptional regulator [unclassified Acinetobacter]MBK0062412.1 LysR family transcriptional regulator [Acinetobacter sp. S55]MBK0066216.1 LysR family transcriptional regulator [Acinetobacter sp. S54]
MSCSSDLPDWKQLVHARIEQLGSIQAVAEELSYSRTSLSLALRGKYVGKTDKLEQRVFEVLGQIQCPFLNQPISTAQCRAYSEREAPTQNPAEMRHWRVCHGCPNK